ncbi:unnamed protein product [Tuber melanosporum]|uniref:(Perigord truffle) hypothetical protein n=1 Tax=Tuber melanosporum (strain Mel28) TaxID=656061 RepID=D5G4X9_TUBMM|nr:unnamed protein product [Tuber melanosporum]
MYSSARKTCNNTRMINEVQTNEIGV